jgi:hypothetical protein
VTITFQRAVRPNRQFWRHVVFDPSGCWPWMGARFSSGYGRVRISRNHTRCAHRVAYELEHGAIPEGQMVCHRCDNPPCCNPQHLFAGTALDNVRDCIAKNRRACHQGSLHPGAKLNDLAVRAIRERYANGASLKTLAAEFGVTPQAIWYAAARKTWSHV